MSDSYCNESAISVGGFFEKYNVCIPILQRDYAQGREGKEYIREVFLKDIKDAITNKQPLTMDFIYGYQERKKEQDEEYNVFYPLDGQQRLTTIWLVYWYLALSSKKLESEKAYLCRFTYQTRKSSREFCEALCANHIDYDPKKDHIVDRIKDQKWFFAAWKNDPTINAMLRMLGGTNGRDGIEPVFSSLAFQQRTWERKLDLFKNNISFFVLDIGSDNLPRESADRLYVKMNARGKALTDFENFKADLVGIIDKIPSDSSPESVKGIPKNLDNSWNDIFWISANSGDSDGQTDEIFFAFINRFCFNRLCIAKVEPSEVDEKHLLRADLIKSIDEILSDSEKSKKLVGISDTQKEILSLYSYYSSDNNIRYTKFDYYQDLLDSDGLQVLSTIFERIKDRIDTIKAQLSDINKVVSQREESKYRYLPIYKSDDNSKKQINTDDNGNKVGIVEGITQKERVYFFAICKYFEDVETFEEEKFKDWMRFCRNVIENSGVDSAAAMITVMRRIDEFDPKDTKDIITALSEMQISSDESTKIEKQIQEEIKKAKKIQSESSGWKERIIDAEKELFLCGKIGFLFTGESGREDWDSFDTKLNNFKRFFDSKGLASIDFVRSYAKSFENFYDVRDKLIFHNKGWQRRGDSWLDILSEDDPRRVDRVLRDKEKPNNAKDDYLLFIDSKSFEYAVEKKGVFDGKNDLRVTWYNKRYALYKKSAQNDKLCFDYSSSEYHLRRNYLLSDLLKVDGFSLDDNHVIVENEAYYFGDDIFFTYREQHYYWSSDDKIYGYDYSKGIKSKEPKLQEVSKKTSCDILPHL
jgi:hypothetical protein